MREPGNLTFRHQSVRSVQLLEAFFDVAGSNEADTLGSLDFHGFAGLGVAALASGAGGNFESSEADELDIAVFLDTLGDAVENCFKSFTRVFLGGFCAESFLDGFD